MTQIKWVFRYMKGCRWQFVLGVIIQLFVFLPLQIIVPMVISELIDTVFLEGDASVTVKLLLMYLCMHIIRAVSSYAHYALQDYASAHVLKTFRITLYDKLQKLSSSFYASTRTGDIMMRLTGDLEMLRHFSAWTLPNLLYCIFLFSGGMVVYFSTNAVLTGIILLAVPAIAAVVWHMRKQSAERHQDWREKGSTLNACAQENIAANRVVKAFAREAFEEEKFNTCNEAYRDSAIAATTVWANHGPVLTAIAQAINICILVFGGIFVVQGQMSIGDLILFYNLSWLITDSTNIIGSVMSETQKFFSSTLKVSQLYYARNDIQNKENAICKTPDESSGKVVFDHVSFKYDKHTVLDDISFEAQPGQTIGIMGPTGSGKSTLVMMLARFMDAQKGQVFIDGTDVKNYDLTCLRRHISYAMQDVFLFSDSIASNIAYGDQTLEEDEIKQYAKMASADGFIRRTSDGYNTVVGERGVGLSGGQKQRISLARALAYETPILVLDDTTSALDMETEHYIQNQLAARDKKQTTFIVAQRISSVKNADKILILENGRITECGTHEELLKNKGYYYDVFCIQQGIENETAKEAAKQ